MNLKLIIKAWIIQYNNHQVFENKLYSNNNNSKIKKIPKEKILKIKKKYKFKNDK